MYWEVSNPPPAARVIRDICILCRVSILGYKAGQRELGLRGKCSLMKLRGFRKALLDTDSCSLHACVYRFGQMSHPGMPWNLKPKRPESKSENSAGLKSMAGSDKLTEMPLFKFCKFVSVYLLRYRMFFTSSLLT